MDNQGVAASPPGHHPFGAEPVPVSGKAGTPNAEEEAFWLGVEYAANYLASYACSLGGPRDWPTDDHGWPTEPKGAERRGYHVFAGLIEESLEHEQLSPTFLSLEKARAAQLPEGGEDWTGVAAGVERIVTDPTH